jgi:hypothetical protein
MTCIPLVGPESKAIRRATFWAPVKPVTELPDSARDNQADRRPAACKEFRICCSCDPVNQWVMRKDIPGEASISLRKAFNRLTAQRKPRKMARMRAFCAWREPAHKTDHRMAANNTLDAIRAAEWHLYFPNQLLHEGLQPWLVPQEFYYYVTEKDANYWVNIDRVVEQKLDAAMAHVSQWEPSINHYRPDWDKADLEKTKAELKRHILKKDGHYVEAFRTTTGFNQE